MGTVAGVRTVDVEIGVMTPEQRTALKHRVGHTRTVPFNDPSSLTRVHAVTSGKGGVGKSTVTVNLAAALAARGQQLGAIDLADRLYAERQANEARAQELTARAAAARLILKLRIDAHTLWID